MGIVAPSLMNRNIARKWAPKARFWTMCRPAPTLAAKPNFGVRVLQEKTHGLKRSLERPCSGGTPDHWTSGRPPHYRHPAGLPPGATTPDAPKIQHKEVCAGFGKIRVGCGGLGGRILRQMAS